MQIQAKVLTAYRKLSRSSGEVGGGIGFPILTVRCRLDTSKRRLASLEGGVLGAVHVGRGAETKQMGPYYMRRAVDMLMDVM